MIVVSMESIHYLQMDCFNEGICNGLNHRGCYQFNDNHITVMCRIRQEKKQYYLLLNLINDRSRNGPGNYANFFLVAAKQCQFSNF